jgi:hypothetical protein
LILYLLDEDEEDLVEEDEDCVSAAQLLGHSTNEGQLNYIIVFILFCI